ncbi:MAG TPA: hypothetical protein VMF86_04950 [Stellaceae bacterium]|nr:hypothetical protein [Stellaceae bacterium]
MRARYSSWFLAAGFAAAAGIAWAQPPANETPQQNVRESEQYEQLLCTNPGFRARRIAKECGPLQGSSLYAGCVASFNCNRQPSGVNWRQAPPSERISK